MNNPECKEFLCVARISSAHGLRGTVGMISYTSSPDLFEPGASVAAGKPGFSRSPLTIVWAKPHRKGFRVQFEGIENRLQAEKLIGSEIFVEASRLPALEEGEYYWHELIGLEVVGGDGRYLGRIASIIVTGSNDVYVVRHEANEVLVPALESVVRSIDLVEGRVIVELPEGLSEITETPGKNG